MYLLDTNVVSEFRRARPHGGVLAWIGSISENQLHVSAVTMFELQNGAETTRRQNALRASELDAWIDTIPKMFDVIDVDGEVFRRAAQLLHGKNPDLLGDGLIAATALVHNLTVVTRNVRDFVQFDVSIFDPFAA